MPNPLILTAAIAGYHILKTYAKKTPKPFHALAYGVGYAGGTNVGFNLFNEYITPFMRTNKGKYIGRPQYVSRL